MTSNTPHTPAAGPLGTDGDINIDMPTHVEVNVARVEDEILLQRLLGISIPHGVIGRTERDKIANDISWNVFRIVGAQRQALGSIQLRDMLAANIDTAINANMGTLQRNPNAVSFRGSQYDQNVRTITDAMKRVIPRETLDLILRNTGGEHSDIFANSENIYGALVASGMLNRDPALLANTKKKNGENKEADEAMHDVILAYLEKHAGLNSQDAKRGANHLLSRGYLDEQSGSANDEVIDEVFGAEDDWWERSRWVNATNFSTSPERRSQRMLGHIAQHSGVPVDWSWDLFHPLLTGMAAQGKLKRIRWRDARSHRSLLTAYFAMKKVIEGNAEGLWVQETRFISEQMKIVSDLLSQNWTYDVLNSYEKLSQKDKEDLKLNKSLGIRLVEQKLRSGPPAAYDGKIDNALFETNRRMDWWRRSFFGGENYGVVRGDRNPFSGKNLLYGNKHKIGGKEVSISAKGLYYDTPLWAGKKVWNTAEKAVKGTWARRWSIAGCALLGTMLLPGIGTMIGAGIGGMKGSGSGGPAAAHAPAGDHAHG